MNKSVSAQNPKKATRIVHLFSPSGCTNTSGYMNTAKPLARTNTNTAAIIVSCNSRRSSRSSSCRLIVAIAYVSARTTNRQTNSYAPMVARRNGEGNRPTAQKWRKGKGLYGYVGNSRLGNDNARLCSFSSRRVWELLPEQLNKTARKRPAIALPIGMPVQQHEQLENLVVRHPRIAGGVLAHL